MSNKKPNRIRKIQIAFYVNDEEMKFIKNKMHKAKMKNKSEYMREMAIYGKVIHFDEQDFKKCYDEFHKIGVNVNQMAKIANETGQIYVDDIQMLKDAYQSYNNLLNSIYLKYYENVERLRKNKSEVFSEQII